MRKLDDRKDVFVSVNENNNNATLTVVILTYNEELHIERAIFSVRDLADRIFVVDSGSTDQTVSIARAAGAEVLSNAWVNYATQFNWALGQLPSDTDWVLRLDADEVIMPKLRNEIGIRLSKLDDAVAGVTVSRRMAFLRRPIYHGGVFPTRIIRLFRHNRGHCENRWMDEHVIVEGSVVDFEGEILDDNINSLNWWTQKHNSYASREVVDLLNIEYRFMDHETVASVRARGQAGLKRWLKEEVYARLPGGVRAFVYFVYRYIFRLGFLDGFEGTAFHVLQGFWYRYLVDVKMFEVRRYMYERDVAPETAIRDVLGIDLRLTNRGGQAWSRRASVEPTEKYYAKS